MKTRITELLGIEHPIFQAAMSWASSNAPLVIAVSNAGGMGVLGAGPMRPEDFSRTLDQIKAGTNKPFGVNIPLNGTRARELLDMLDQLQIAAQADRRAFGDVVIGRDEQPVLEVGGHRLSPRGARATFGAQGARRSAPRQGAGGAIADAGNRDDGERAEVLFLAALAREPQEDERTSVVAALSAAKTSTERSEVLSDVLWALLNSTEFAFIR